MVIWVIGLSAAGKTRIASAMCRILRQQGERVVLVDGDMVRAITGHDLDHSVEGRRRNAGRIRALCAELDRQGLHVVCAILSIFPESSAWNREHIRDYREVYVRVRPDTVRRRDPKGLYAAAEAGRMPNVVGVDIPFPPPERPDAIIDNDRDGADLDEVARQTLDRLGLFRPGYDYPAVNLRRRPCKYEYTAFQGPGFFDAYARNRREALAMLEEKSARLGRLTLPGTGDHPMAEILGVPESLRGSLAVELPLHGKAVDEHGRITTALWLMDALAGLGRGVFPDDAETLLRRFEVSKKVRAAYGPAFSKVTEADDAMLYVLFGNLLAGCCRALSLPRRLIFLNALLKVDDILVSECAGLALPAEVHGARRSLLQEMALVRDMLREVG